jgi:hypothetical protein
MKRYLGLNLESLVASKGDLSGLFPPEINKLHVHTIMTRAMEEIERNLEVLYHKTTLTAIGR